MTGLLLPLHGFGGASDLPLPLWMAISGSVLALVVSFAVLGLKRHEPRYDGTPADRPALVGGLVDHPASAWILRVLGLLFFGYLTWALVAGPDLVTNPVFGTFYVLVWVGLVPLSLLFGRVARALNPVRTLNLLLARATGGDPDTGILEYPARLGYWPAAVTVFAFVWQELVNPQSAYLGSLRLWLAAYLAVGLVGSAVFGARWLERADPFEVYSDLLARLSVWGRREDGTLVVRPPLTNLATTPPLPGLLAVVAVLFGSTAYDSYKETFDWQRFVSFVGLPNIVTNTAGLLVFCLVVGGSFSLAARLATAPTVPSRELPARLAHSVVPIIVGYMTAHYLSYLVEQGQTTIIQLSDPMVDGSNLLGTADWSVSYWLSFHPGLLAVVKLLAVVTGHVVGVFAAHDRALTLLPPGRRVVGQLAMLLVMVAYTTLGLYLLMKA